MSKSLQRATRKLLRPLKRRLQPTPTPADLSEFTEPTLVLIAHPDDEVFCSGLICELLKRDQKVHLVCFTRGEGGERGSLPQQANLPKHREEELSQAAAALQVSSLTILDYVDPPMENGRLSEPPHDGPELLNEIEQLISRHGVQNLITHGSGGEYWHPAHLCLHRQARNLSRRLPQLQLWSFNAWTAQHPLPQVLNQDDPTHLNFDASEHYSQRLQSLTCHRSQQAVFERFGNGSLADFIQLTSHENYRKW